MIIKDGIENLKKDLFCQLSAHWTTYNKEKILHYMDMALDRMKIILSEMNFSNHYIWNEKGETVFIPYNSIQYSIFLYLLANSIYKGNGGIKEADIIYYLNKIMNGCDWFYAIEFPDSFFVEHPVGSVMGRAKYGEHFFFYQGTTVGGQRDKQGNLHYPVIGNNVVMYANSSIIGKSIVGNNVIVSTDTTIRNENIPDNSLVFGKSPFLTIKERSEAEILKMQNHIFRGGH